MNMILEGIADRIIEQMEKLEEQRIRPSFVIIGRREYEAIVKDQNDHSTINPTGMDGAIIFDLRLVPDFDSESRVTVTYEVGLRNDRKRCKSLGITRQR